MKHSDYPLLNALAKGSERIAALSQDPNALLAFHEAEGLLEKVQTLPIRGVEKVVLDGSASLHKFQSLLSEVRFAVTFASLGATVDLLRDEAFGRSAYTPDLRIRLPDGADVLIEVTRLSHGDPDVAGAIEKKLTEFGLLFDLEYVLGERFGTPAATYGPRTANERSVARAVDALVAQLERCDENGDSHGVVRMFDGPQGTWCEVLYGEDAYQLRYEEVEMSAEHWVGSFGFCPSHYDSPMVGGGITAFRIVRDEEHRHNLTSRLSIKANRRAALPPHFQGTLFVIALENEEASELSPEAVLSELTGSRCSLTAGMPRATPLPEEIQRAAETGWRQLLEEWNYFDELVRFQEFGAFFQQRASWARELSGVLVRHNRRRSLQWLPNPFAGGNLASTRLLTLPISSLESPEETPPE